VSEAVLCSRVLYGFFIAFSRLTPTDKHPQRHAFINTLSTCYLPNRAAIAETVKVSKSFVHKTCKNPGPQTFEIPACDN